MWMAAGTRAGRRRLPLLLAVAAARLAGAEFEDVAAAWDHSLNTLLGPHGQPPTYGQDSLSCGYLVLPTHITLRARSAGQLQRGGTWLSTDGQATLATWEQELFRWNPEKVYYYRGAQMLLKTEHHFEGFETGDYGDKIERVTFQDCESVPMYSALVHRLHGGRAVEYDVFDAGGLLVARARYKNATHYPGYVPEQLLFTDAYGWPIAIATTPEIGSNHQPPEYAIRPWEVSFYEPTPLTSRNSTLSLPGHRWVIVATVQDYTIRVADNSNQLTDFRPYYVGTCVLVVVAAAAAVSALFGSVYYTVHPPISEDIKQKNPYLRPNGAYGSLGPRTWEHRAPPAARPVGSQGSLASPLPSLAQMGPAGGW